MYLTVIAICVVVPCFLILIWIRRTRDKHELELHSITPEALRTCCPQIRKCSSWMFASRSVF
jgi:hypothetical protein